MPRYGCVNVHASLLPKYRGAAPIQWAVINGDAVTGVTTMRMDEGLDTGDMILKEEVKIRVDETGGSLFDRLSEVGAKLRAHDGGDRCGNGNLHAAGQLPGNAYRQDLQRNGKH